MSDTQILIIGGGISGLSTAWWLAQRGIDVEVWEADTEPGGKIRSSHEQGYLTERAAGLLVNFRPQIDALIRQAGLDDRKRSRHGELNRYVVHHGQLAQVPMRLPAMALSPLWSRAAKLRLLAEILVPRGGGSDESVTHFVQRRLGEEILETAIDPFIAGTLASDPDLASAEAVLPRLKALEQRYGSISLGMLINRVLKRRRANLADTFSFQGGLSELIQALVANPGIQLHTGTLAKGLEPTAEGWQATGSGPFGPRQARARHLVICTPAPAAAALLGPLDGRLAAELSGIRYAPLSVLHLGLPRNNIHHPLDGSGFLVPRREGLTFNGNLWMSNLFPGRAPEGQVLLTSYVGGARAPARAEQSQERLLTDTLQGLGRLLGIKGDPDYVRLDRHTQALPLYHGDYPARTARIEGRLARHPGLHLSANYLGGVSVRERLYQGMQTARQIEQRLRCAGYLDDATERPLDLGNGRPLHPAGP